MAKRANTIFHDEELLVTLPSASFLVHVDDNNATWTKKWVGSKVDWAWQEPEGFYLCELKDPECKGALLHPQPTGKPSHADITINKLIGETFPDEFAANVRDTLANQPHAKAATNIRYIVVAAISHSNFMSAVAMTAGDIIKRDLAKMQIDIPVVVLNIAEWNAQLAPRKLDRVL